MDTLIAWKEYVIKNWKSLYVDTKSLNLQNTYQQLLTISLLPLIKTSNENRTNLFKDIKKYAPNDSLHSILRPHFKNDKTRTIPELNTIVQTLSKTVKDTSIVEEALSWLITNTGALAGVQKDDDSKDKLIDQLVPLLDTNYRHSATLRVEAKTIQAGHNIAIAGNDVNITTHYYTGNKSDIKGYLEQLRSEWNYTDLGNILPASNIQISHLVRLHQLYTPMDIWSEKAYEQSNETQVAELQQRAIDQDLQHLRYPALEAVAIHPLVVIVGSAGTGKSTLARFIATCLAYASDSSAEKQDKVNGLELLGAPWIHGAILPIYISLRNLVTNSTHFPKTLKDANAQVILNYLTTHYPNLGADFKQYLMNDEIPTHGTILLLDGLDEVYAEKDKRILQKIIVSWARRFPKSRILVTTRAYAYKANASWRLPNEFKVVELAPYTLKQVQMYIHNWYAQALMIRPKNFGGSEQAEAQTNQLAKNLIQRIQETSELWSLARQPLLLALIVLIHEEQRQLPINKAELYEQTVKLLYRWRPLDEIDPLAGKLSNLDFKQVRAALQIVAFELQRDHTPYQKFPMNIKRAILIEKLMQQQNTQRKLGASIEDVLEYLATRNGILVSGPNATYRFLHLSIQEYLAACALLEQYNECKMPESLPSPKEGYWQFPENIAILVKNDPYRWREVALFSGTILASNKGQDQRWHIIEQMLPNKKSVGASDGITLSICIAADIWSNPILQMRLPSHKLIQQHLTKSLETVIADDRLDAPERARAIAILEQLRKTK